MSKRLWWVVGAFLALGCSDDRRGGSDDGEDSAGDATDVSDGFDGAVEGLDGQDGTEAGDGSDGTDSVDETADGTDTADGTGDGTDARDGSTDATDATDTEDGSDGTGGECPGGCPDGQECIGGTCQVPQICEPNKKFCQGLTAVKACNADGTAFLEPVSCPAEQYCSSGKCGSKCVVDPKLGAYVGCKFWSVDLPNYPDPTINPTPENSPHAVVVSNPGELETEVSFEAPDGTAISFADLTVAGHSSQVFVMPIRNVQHSGIFDLGIRMESTRPVLVHQFNPWDNKYSNDASLLLPENVLGTDYVVLAWPSSPFDAVQIPGFPTPPNQNGYFTVLATEDGTEVNFQVAAHVRANDVIPELAPGSLFTVELDRGQVLNVESDQTSLFTQDGDLSGSRVWSNRPIAVFAGHEEAVIGPEVQTQPGEEPPSSCCADHLEEQLLPTNLLGTAYVAAKSKPRGSEVDFWRIQAADANVTITTNPVQTTTDGDTVSGLVLSQKGSWIEIQTSDSFEVTSDKPVQVMQYLVSQSFTEEFTGDPSQIGAVPTDRFRTFYALSVPPLKGGFLEPLFGSNYVSIIKRTGEPVTVDGAAIAESEFKAFGPNGWRVAYVSLDAGVHTAESAEAFGLVAYGFNGAVSYGFSGGLQIETIAEDP